MKKSSIIMERNLFEKLKETAKREGRTMAWYIHKGLKKMLEGENNVD